ncbi:isochorismatase family protein [Micromonosporaceae bacterium Da 78-11]
MSRCRWTATAANSASTRVARTRRRGRSARPRPARPRYFTAPFQDEEPLARAASNIADLRKVSADLGLPVIFTRQPGGQSRADRGLLLDMWGWGPPADPAAIAFHDELLPGAGDVVVEKRRYSAFVDSGFADLLGDRDQLLITGIYAHIGVTATACDAFMRGIQAFVVAGFTRADHVTALGYVAKRCGTVLSTGQLRAALD